MRVIRLMNFLEEQPSWKDTAVVVMYDDSDGWYDHQLGPIVNTSSGAADALTGPGMCGNPATALPGLDPGNLHALGRCGYGPRLPLLVISPWARENFVDSTVTDQTSVLRFIEDNWLGGQRIGQGSYDELAGPLIKMADFSHFRSDVFLILDPSTGEQAQ